MLVRIEAWFMTGILLGTSMFSSAWSMSRMLLSSWEMNVSNASWKCMTNVWNAWIVQWSIQETCMTCCLLETALAWWWSWSSDILVSENTSPLGHEVIAIIGLKPSQKPFTTFVWYKGHPHSRTNMMSHPERKVKIGPRDTKSTKVVGITNSRQCLSCCACSLQTFSLCITRTTEDEENVLLGSS